MFPVILHNSIAQWEYAASVLSGSSWKKISCYLEKFFMLREAASDLATCYADK